MVSPLIFGLGSQEIRESVLPNDFFLEKLFFKKKSRSRKVGDVGLHKLVLQPVEDSFEMWWHISSQRVQGQHRRGFNSLVILGAWVIWKHRN
jgi:hypothetical protein